MHDGREGLHDDAAFSCSMAVEGEEREGDVRFSLKNWTQSAIFCTNRNTHTHNLQLQDLLSFEGRGFFSCVSVFFSLDLSKLVTSEMSGLSLIVAESVNR